METHRVLRVLSATLGITNLKQKPAFPIKAAIVQTAAVDLFLILDLYLIPVLSVKIAMSSFYEEERSENFSFYCDSSPALWANVVFLPEVVL